ncbi:hypothetical protein F5B20DRAFT_159830 [Whalleya microplaca]|nr:hypothetical protein F5B20DRAFT_159830 [Whalleya microplaca]
MLLRIVMLGSVFWWISSLFHRFDLSSSCNARLRTQGVSSHCHMHNSLRQLFRRTETVEKDTYIGHQGMLA